MGIQIRQLPTAEREQTLPILFAIFHSNMQKFDPWEESRWCAVISNALEDPRRIMLVATDEESAEIVGFFMYACNGENFLMEEIQLIPRVQGIGLFRAIYAEVLPRLPDTVVRVEAYAHKDNLHSQGILSHLGLSMLEGGADQDIRHWRGDFQTFLQKFNS